MISVLFIPAYALRCCQLRCCSFGEQLCGVPEGDPVAVVAMTAMTFFASDRLEHDLHIPLQSYVDNWALQTATGGDVLRATAHVAESVSAIAMRLAPDTVKFYSMDEKIRTLLRKSSTLCGGARFPGFGCFLLCC